MSHLTVIRRSGFFPVSVLKDHSWCCRGNMCLDETGIGSILAPEYVYFLHKQSHFQSLRKSSACANEIFYLLCNGSSETLNDCKKVQLSSTVEKTRNIYRYYSILTLDF